jgi:hypothetical protein
MSRLLAQTFHIGGDGSPSFGITGPSQNAGGVISMYDTIGTIVGKSLTYVFAFAGFGLLLMIIASGFTLMLSVGDPKKMEKGKATLTNAIIGFIVIFAAFWIVQILGIVFGWDNYIGTMFQ